MNNLEQTNRLTDTNPLQVALSQSRLARYQTQFDEKRYGFRYERDSTPRMSTERSTSSGEKIVLRIQGGLPLGGFGLTDSLTGQLTISCFVPHDYPRSSSQISTHTSYEKNGILVHHVGRRITSKDVEEALSEE